MTIPEFIKAVEGYYGKYKPGTKSVVVQYLREEQLHPDRLREIWRHLVKTVSGQYAFTPDVATIEQARREIRSVRAAPAEYRPALPDPAAEQFRPELEGLLKGLVDRFSLRRHREKDEVIF